jgi:hypothetical protein
MVISDFNIVGISIPKTEADPPLVFDRDRVLILSISLQAVKAVARRNPEIITSIRLINIFEPPESPFQQVRLEPI